MGKQKEEKTKFILSDSTKTNSKGFRLLLAGGNYDRFDNNPVMLYDHDIKLVIGRWENRRIENGLMLADPIFDMEDPIAAEKARKVKAGFLNGSSVGIIPLELTEVEGELVMSKWELLEASIVAIPSDSGAVRLYNEKREELSLEQVKLSLINTNINNKTMDKLILSAVTLLALGLAENCTAKDIELAVAEKDRMIGDLKSQISTMKQNSIDEYLSACVKSSKITEAEKANYLKLAQTDFDSVKAILDSKPESASAKLSEQVNQSKTTLTAGREDWDYIKWMKEDPKGLQKLKHENPSAFEKLQLTIK